MKWLKDEIKANLDDKKDIENILYDIETDIRAIKDNMKSDELSSVDLGAILDIIENDLSKDVTKLLSKVNELKVKLSNKEQ